MILAATRATDAKRRRAAGRSSLRTTPRRSTTFDAALAELETLQTDDFAGLFRAMDGLPVVIRLIDPPLHEFLPSPDELIEKMTRLRTLQEKNLAARTAIDCRPRAAGLQLFGPRTPPAR